jgi:hypothetical protein
MKNEDNKKTSARISEKTNTSLLLLKYITNARTIDQFLNEKLNIKCTFCRTNLIGITEYKNHILEKHNEKLS